MQPNTRLLTGAFESFPRFWWLYRHKQLLWSVLLFFDRKFWPFRNATTLEVLKNMLLPPYLYFCKSNFEQKLHQCIKRSIVVFLGFLDRPKNALRKLCFYVTGSPYDSSIVWRVNCHQNVLLRAYFHSPNKKSPKANTILQFTLETFYCPNYKAFIAHDVSNNNLLYDRKTI